MGPDICQFWTKKGIRVMIRCEAPLTITIPPNFYAFDYLASNMETKMWLKYDYS